MACDDTTRKRKLRDAIRLYITKHPRAGDTAEGIIACWLPQRGFEDAPDHIAAVLEEMVAKRWLQIRRLADGKILYTRSDDFDA